MTTNQCTASGNDNLASVQAAIAAATGVNVELTLYGKSDDIPAKFIFSPNADPSEGKSTNFSVVDGTLISYVTVKASNQFKVYQLAGARASSGLNFSALGITNNGGQQPDISHLSFFTAAAPAVPEPSTWAMMLFGFGAVGGAMRAAKSKAKLKLSYAWLRPKRRTPLVERLAAFCYLVCACIPCAWALPQKLFLLGSEGRRSTDLLDVRSGSFAKWQLAALRHQ